MPLTCTPHVLTRLWGSFIRGKTMLINIVLKPRLIQKLFKICVYHRNRLTHLENKFSSTREEKRGDGLVREFEVNFYTRLYLKWITNKDLLYSTGNSAQCYAAAWMGEEFGGEWVHVYVRRSHSTLYMKRSQRC